MRIPNFAGTDDEGAEGDGEFVGCSADIEMLKRFLDPSEFYQTLNLDSDQMKQWDANLART